MTVKELREVLATFDDDRVVVVERYSDFTDLTNIEALELTSHGGWYNLARYNAKSTKPRIKALFLGDV